MKDGRIWLCHVGVMGLVLAVSGCGGGMASVSGTVTYEGKPIETGQIIFNPTDGKGAVSGGPIENGKYTVRGVLPGPKTVRIEAYRKVNFASSSQEMMERAAQQKRKGNDSGLVDPADVISENAQGNNQKVDLVAGSNSKDFSLSKPGTKKK